MPDRDGGLGAGRRTRRNIPLPSEELAQRLSHGDFEIVSVKGAGGGIMGAKKLRLRFDDGVEINAK